MFIVHTVRMKAAVIFRSRYGSTKQYAEWIVKELGADLFEADDAPKDLAAYDTVIIGGYLRMGKIQGADVLVSRWSELTDKRVIFFSVAAAPADNPERTKWFEENVPAHIREQARHFPLRGRAMHLNLADRMLVAFPSTILTLTAFFKPTPENIAARDGFKPFDGVARANLEPLLSFVRERA